MQFLSSTRRRRTVTHVAALLLAAPLLAASVAAGAAPAGAATAASLAPQRIGTAPGLPRGARLLGALAASTTMQVEVVLEPRDPAALTAFASAVSTPGSPLYRHYLARGQFATRFGATPAAVAAVEASLRAEGLRPGPVSADRLSIPVTATEGELAKAFSTSFERVAVGGRVAYANTAAPLFAGAVKSAVEGVIGLDDLYLPRPELVAAKRSTGSAH